MDEHITRAQYDGLWQEKHMVERRLDAARKRLSEVENAVTQMKPLVDAAMAFTVVDDPNDPDAGPMLIFSKELAIAFQIAHVKYEAAQKE